MGAVLDWVETMKNVEGPDVVSGPSHVLNYIGFNNSDPRFKDLRVRQAILLALDRQSIVKNIFAGTAELANCVLTLPKFVPADLNKYETNAAKAKSLLAEAGWEKLSGGDPVELLTYYSDQGSKDVMATIQSMLAAVGVKVNPRFVDPPTYAQIAESGEFSMVFAGQANGPDPSVLNSVLDSNYAPPRGLNRMRVSIPEVDKLIEAGKGESDDGKRSAIYQQLCRVTNAQLPWVPLWVANRFGDNIGFVKIETTLAEGGVIQNNHLTGPGTYTPIGGAAGVYFRQVQRIRILNNHIRNYQKGLFMKHPNYLLDNPGQDSDIEIAHNYIEDCASAIAFNGCYAKIHNNLLGPRNGGIMFGEDGGFWPNISSLADFNLVEHNTIFLDPTVPFGIMTPVIEMIQFGRDPGWGDPYPGSTHNVFRNNIMGGRLMSHYYGAGLSYNNTYDYNLYHNRAGDGGHYAIAAEHRVEYATLAAWGAHTGGDQHSTRGNPLYGGGANPATIAGFALAAGSPGKNAGSDGKDMGADVTKVGIQPSLFTITSPNGGEAWQRGESRPITWTSNGVTGNVVIELVQNGTAVGIIADNVAASAGTFLWTVGRLANGTYRSGTNLKILIRTASAQPGPGRGHV